eukprot:SAG31_NODE_4099_length_3584_cov_1.990531_2_plen_77_part_00
MGHPGEWRLIATQIFAGRGIMMQSLNYFLKLISEWPSLTKFKPPARSGRGPGCTDMHAECDEGSEPRDATRDRASI